MASHPTITHPTSTPPTSVTSGSLASQKSGQQTGTPEAIEGAPLISENIFGIGEGGLGALFASMLAQTGPLTEGEEAGVELPPDAAMLEGLENLNIPDAVPLFAPAPMELAELTPQRQGVIDSLAAGQSQEIAELLLLQAEHEESVQLNAPLQPTLEAQNSRPPSLASLESGIAQELADAMMEQLPELDHSTDMVEIQEPGIEGADLALQQHKAGQNTGQGAGQRDPGDSQPHEQSGHESETGARAGTETFAKSQIREGSEGAIREGREGREESHSSALTQDAGGTPTHHASTHGEMGIKGQDGLLDSTKLTLDPRLSSLPDQISLSMAKATSDGSSAGELKLSMDVLGDIQINFELASDGKTNVVIAAAEAKTLELLMDGQDSLKKALAQHELQANLSFNMQQDPRNPFLQQQNFGTGTHSMTLKATREFSNQNNLPLLPQGRLVYLVA